MQRDLPGEDGQRMFYDDRDEDRDKVERARQGDRAAFDQLVERYRTAVCRYCSRFFSEPEDAQDAVQETFLRAWRYIGGFRGECSFESWVYRIATNVCKNFLNKKTLPTGCLDDFLEYPDPAPSVEQWDTWRQMLENVWKSAIEAGWDDLDVTD